MYRDSIGQVRSISDRYCQIQGCGYEGDGMSKVNAKKLTERPCLTCGRYTSNKVVCCDKCLERGRKIAEMAK